MTVGAQTLPAGGGTTVPPPAVLLPDPVLMFDRRSRRLAAWADGHPMGEYLDFLSHIAAAQHRAVAAQQAPDLDPARLEQRASGGMPLLPREAAALPADWLNALNTILDVAEAQRLPEAARRVVETLRAEEATTLNARAAAILTGQRAPDDLAAGLFISAALQVVWGKAAGALDPALPKTLDPAGLCPVCGSPPVAAVVMAADPLEGVRYLACGLCGTHWHHPRGHCSSCGAEKGVAYLSFEGQAGHARGETCGECRTYLKVFDEAKSPGTEPFADDLATVGLDLRLGEEGWHRLAANPFLQGGA